MSIGISDFAAAPGNIKENNKTRSKGVNKDIRGEAPPLRRTTMLHLFPSF